jgi:hypothetical protein
VRCPTLADLPPPPAGRVGWPWTEESSRLPEHHAGTRSWPRVSVVTPSFNQGRFLEETIRSILLQGYPNLEYFVLDGGSTDSSVEVIQKYAHWLDFWVSEPDRGQSAAINRGLKMAAGILATWINSDDLLCKDAFYRHFSAHAEAADTIFVGDCINIDEGGTILSTQRGCVHSLEDLVRIRSIWRADGYLSQQAILFPTGLAHRVGLLNEDNHYSMDYELWGEFLLAGARVVYTGVPFGFFRLHRAQKTMSGTIQTESTLNVAARLIRSSSALSSTRKAELLADLEAYRQEYPQIAWRHTGRLARLGLPRPLVDPIRTVRQTLEATFETLMRSVK